MRHKDIFNHIYRQNIWGKGSGAGSSLEATVSYRWFLQNFIRMNCINSVLDVGCGDWQFSQAMEWRGIQYTGIDVSDVVLYNARRFAASNIAFLELDAVVDELPIADLLVAKDVVQHWSNRDIFRFLLKLKPFARVLITNGFHPDGMNSLNRDIDTGGWRPVDLLLEPFCAKGSYVHWFSAGEPKSIFYMSHF